MQRRLPSGLGRRANRIGRAGRPRRLPSTGSRAVRHHLRYRSPTTQSLSSAPRWPPRCASLAARLSDVKNAVVCSQHRLVHRLERVGCGKIVTHQLVLCRLEAARDRVALDQLGDVRSKVRAEQLAAARRRWCGRPGFSPRGVALPLPTHRGSVRRAPRRPVRARLLLGEPDARDLRDAVGAARDQGRIERLHLLAQRCARRESRPRASPCAKPWRTGGSPIAA